MELPIRKIDYLDPPTYKTVNSYRPYLRNVSDYSCLYCGTYEAESCGATFTIDHFRPKSLFEDLVSECNNLRYSCPRCNSYKSNLWITKEQGCIRDCNKCENKSCKENIQRFVDVIVEDPTEIMYLSDDNKICAYEGSNVAQYTIDYLRLNRIQLIRLRHIRRFMEDWENELNNKKHILNTEKRELAETKNIFLASANESNKYFPIINTLFEMLEKLYENQELLVDMELSNLSKLKSGMRGKDDKSLTS